MLKLKIHLTVFVLYEIVAVMLLNCAYTCESMFGATFCANAGFKYFIGCFAVPAVIGLVCMWISEVYRQRRRRNSIMFKAKTAVKDMFSNVRETISENVTSEDLERVALAAVSVAVKKYADKRAKKSADKALNNAASKQKKSTLTKTQKTKKK